LAQLASMKTTLTPVVPSISRNAPKRVIALGSPLLAETDDSVKEADPANPVSVDRETLHESTQKQNPQTIEESLCFSDLVQLKAGMDNHHKQGRELTEEDFLNVVKTLNLNRTDEDLSRWFRRIDANANHKTTWDEVGTYLLSEGHQRSLTDHRNFEYTQTGQPRRNREKGAHCDAMSQILVNQRFQKVMTTGRDGKIKIWNGETLAFEKVMYQGSKWIVDAKLIHGGQHMVACFCDRKLCVFDCKAGEMVKCYAGKKKKHAQSDEVEADTIDTRGYRPQGRLGTSPPFDLRGAMRNKDLTFEEFKRKLDRDDTMYRSIDIITLDDFVENVHCLEVYERGYDDLAFLGLRDGKLLGYKLIGPYFNVETIYKGAVHGEPISFCRYSKGQQGVFTCSWDKSIKLTNIENNKQREFGTEVGHQKAVFCLDWCESMKLLATGGTEHEMFLWHPVMEKKPLFKLAGHQAPLTSIKFVEGQNQLISMDSDRIIKIWDTRIFKAITLIHDTTTQIDRTFEFLTYDVQRARILTGNNMPVYYTNKPSYSAMYSQAYVGHTVPPVAALYSPDFEQVLTIDNEVVNLWNLFTGAKVFHFGFHMDNEMRIVQAALDSNKRRLITATNTGDIGTWNYFNGQRLNSYENKGSEVYGMTHVQRVTTHFLPLSSETKVCISRFLVTASGHVKTKDSRKTGLLHVYEDTDQFDVSAHWSIEAPRGTLHCEGIGEVSALTVATETLIGAGTEEGVVFFLNIITGSIEHGHVPETLSEEIGRGSRVQGMYALPAKGSTMLVAKNDGNIELWNTSLKAALGSFSIGQNTTLENPHVFADNSTLVYSDAYGNVYVHSLIMTIPHSSEWGGEFYKSVEEIRSDMMENSVAFRAHKDQLTALTSCAPRDIKRVFLVTTGTDTYTKLFSLEGACLGIFGEHRWDLMKESTWLCQNPEAPLEKGDRRRKTENTLVVQERDRIQNFTVISSTVSPNDVVPTKDSSCPIGALPSDLRGGPSLAPQSSAHTGKKRQPRILPSEEQHSPAPYSPVKPSCAIQSFPSPPRTAALSTKPRKPNSDPLPRPCSERQDRHTRRLGLLKPKLASGATELTTDPMDPSSLANGPSDNPQQSPREEPHNQNKLPLIHGEDKSEDVPNKALMTDIERGYNYIRDQLIKDQPEYVALHSLTQESETVRIARRARETLEIKSIFVAQTKKDASLTHWTERVSSRINLDIAKMQEVQIKRIDGRGRGGGALLRSMGDIKASEPGSKN